jgi:hypothetical protein
LCVGRGWRGASDQDALDATESAGLNGSVGLFSTFVSSISRIGSRPGRAEYGGGDDGEGYAEEGLLTRGRITTESWLSTFDDGGMGSGLEGEEAVGEVGEEVEKVKRVEGLTGGSETEGAAEDESNEGGFGL